MSEKDKRTIIIAAVALLIFGIIFLGIRPAVTGIKEAKSKNVELSAQKQAMETEINSLSTYKANLEGAKAEYKTTSARVFADLTNDKIHDEVINNIVTPLGLTITSLQITDAAEMGVAPYIIGEEGATGGITAGASKVAFVNIGVTGSQDQIISLVDKLNVTEGIYLQSASFAASGEATVVNIPFYMVLSETFE